MRFVPMHMLLRSIHPIQLNLIEHVNCLRPVKGPMFLEQLQYAHQKAPRMSLMSFVVCTARSPSCCSDTCNLPKAQEDVFLADQVNRTGFYIHLNHHPALFRAAPFGTGSCHDRGKEYTFLTFVGS